MSRFPQRRAAFPLGLALLCAALFLVACGEETPTGPPTTPAPSVTASPDSLALEAEAGGTASDTVAVSYEDLDARPTLSVEGDADAFEVTLLEETGTPEEGMTSYRVAFDAPASAGEDDAPAATLVFSGANAEAGESAEAEVRVTGRINGEGGIANPPGRPD